MGSRRLEIRNDILEKVSSAEAAKATPYLSMVYLRLTQAPPRFWEQENILRFAETVEGGQTITAWAQLITITRISSAVTKKALEWLHDQKIITYFSTLDEREIILSFEGLKQE